MSTTSSLITPGVKASMAHDVIHYFFNACPLPHARKLLQEVMLSALSSKPTKENPSNIIWFLELIEDLTLAAITISKGEACREEVILQWKKDSEPDITALSQYYNPKACCSPWQFVPRFLTAKQYANPYKVFEKLGAFASKKEWSYLFHELRDYSFYRASFAEGADSYNPLKLYLLLNKLLEAAHLIQVRSKGVGVTNSMIEGGDPASSAG